MLLRTVLAQAARSCRTKLSQHACGHDRRVRRLDAGVKLSDTVLHRSLHTSASSSHSVEADVHTSLHGASAKLDSNVGNGTLACPSLVSLKQHRIVSLPSVTLVQLPTDPQPSVASVAGGSTSFSASF